MPALLRLFGLAAAACWGTIASAEVYEPPTHVSLNTIVSTIQEFMRRPDIPMAGAERAYVEDIVRINAVDMDWDIGMSVHEPADSKRIAVGADGKKIGIFLLHGGSGDFKSMHKRANLMARKLGYKVVSMSYPGRHAFHTESRDWPGSNVTAHDYFDYSLEVRTPLWLRGEYITRDQYVVIKDTAQRARYGTRTLAKAKPGTTFYYRMAGWPMAFEKGGISAMQRHFPEDEYSIYLHGHSTGGPFTMMLSQRVPNIAGILAIENSSFGYIFRAQAAWGGQLGAIEGFERVDKVKQLPSRSDPFDELYIRSWRDRARYAGPELLGSEGPDALFRLPAIMEDILDSWGELQPRAQFKAEYIVTHGIEDSLRAAATVTAERMKLNKADTKALTARYIGLTRELTGDDVKPVPPIMFQISAHSRDHSKEVYEVVVIPMFRQMKPAPKVSLTQFDAATHGYMSGEVAEGIDLGIGPAVFQQWDDAIKGGFFVTDHN